MSRRLALLRGVNVSGHNKVPMAELRGALGAAGAEEVATYIQSGNIALEFPGDDDELISLVARALLEQFDVEVPVVVVQQSDVARIIEQAPFGPDADPAFQLIYFADATVDQDGMSQLDRNRYDGDEITAGDRAVYVSYENGQSKSRLTLDALERAAGCTLTGRNLRSAAKLTTL